MSRRRASVFTTVILLAAAAVLIGVYAAGSRLDFFGDRGSSATGSLLSGTGSGISSGLSDGGASSTEPTAVPTATVTLPPTATPKPTFPPVTPGALATKKLGWFYFASGKEGVSPTVQDSQQAMCDRFSGIWQGDTSSKKVYITMDIGYDYNNNTAKILDIAKEKKFQITFFVVGNLFENEKLKPVFLRMYQEGHIIASHSWNHATMYDEMYLKSGADAVTADLRKVEDAYFKLTGAALPEYFRFPSGEYSEAVMSHISSLGYKIVFWSFAYKDWLVDDQPDPDDAMKTITKGLHDGAILLLHEVSNTNVEILPELVDEIRAKGYEIGSIGDLG